MLFRSKEQLGTLVGSLSGGEHARIRIASLMLQPADILLLDEPTNDLDIPTLEVLEGALLEFPGSIILITHDRFMLQRIATEYIALNDTGDVKMFAGYEQWQDYLANIGTSTHSKLKKQPKELRQKSISVKLSFNLQREFDGMEVSIGHAELKVQESEGTVNDPLVMDDHQRHAEACKELAQAHEMVRDLYKRWAELEAMQG